VVVQHEQAGAASSIPAAEKTLLEEDEAAS
jgi:hypothetical protein